MSLALYWGKKRRKLLGVGVRDLTLEISLLRERMRAHVWAEKRLMRQEEKAVVMRKIPAIFVIKSLPSGARRPRFKSQPHPLL